ncbi:MAG: bifunctional oligoribonuclease/PAP phosphatase NrnA [Bacilli bacterium]|nr:bifunctional oligoribonuclease/PAP phosphatase NrnA [Bacilli bacterium]
MRLNKKILENILNKIEEYDRIIVYRHVSPDFDALGTQLGVYHFLKHNFPTKEIYKVGFTNVEVGHNLFEEMDNLSDEFVKEKPFLAIVVDTATAKRVSDERFTLADYIIKIDHHPNVDPYGDINLVETSCGAAAELLTHVFTSRTFKKYPLNSEAAKNLYIGVIGDTGRYQFSNTTVETLKAGAKLLGYGFNVQSEVHYPMYVKTLKDFEVQKYIMNNYKVSPNGVAYYHLPADVLDRLNIDSDEAKVYMGMFSFVEGINIWVCFSEDNREHNWRASIRSRSIVINEVATKYGGGGHKQASGARPKDYEDTLNLIKDLDALV